MDESPRTPPPSMQTSALRSLAHVEGCHLVRRLDMTHQEIEGESVAQAAASWAQPALSISSWKPFRTNSESSSQFRLSGILC